MRLGLKLKRFFQHFGGELTAEDQGKVVESRREFVQIFDGLEDPVVVIGRNYVIRKVNRPMLMALNKKSFQEFIGRPCYEMIHGLSERCPQCTAPMTFSSGKKSARTGLIGAKADSRQTPYSITCHPLRDEKGEVVFVTEYYRNCSEIMKLSRAVYESERARVMEPLAAGLAHQVRQPLTIIRSTAQYLLGISSQKFSRKDCWEALLRGRFLQGPFGKDYRESLESILENADTLNGVVAEFLHFSRPSQYEMKKVPLARLLEQGLRLIQQKIKDQRIRVTKSWPSDLPEVSMDEKLVLQAYLNLLVNSLESMSAGGTLSIRACVLGNPGDSKIQIEIRDTGKGIPKEMISKLFQPFFSTKETGVGLGLPVAEGIIRSHGGRIEFESEENVGTKVMVELPLGST